MSKITYFNFNTNYRERRKENEITTENIDEYLNLIQQNHKVYEILYNVPVKLFIDIDGVDINKPTLVNEFIQDFINFLNVEFNTNLTPDDYALTFNSGSGSHAGLSYHIYIPKFYVKDIYNMKYILTLFVKHNDKYYNYTDGIIYHYNRLFRATNQYNAKYDKSVEELKDENNQDVHILKHGTLKDTVIQYTAESTLLNVQYNYNKIVGFKLKNTSYDVQKAKLKQKCTKQTKLISNLKAQLKANGAAEQVVENKNEKEVLELFDKYKELIKFDDVDKNKLTFNQIENIVLRCEVIVKTKELLNEYIKNIVKSDYYNKIKDIDNDLK